MTGLLPLGVLMTVAVAAGSPEPRSQMHPGEIERGRAEAELRAYVEDVRDYQRGRDVSELVSRRDMQAVRRLLEVVNTRDDPWRPWAASRLQAAALMHTDAALRLLERAENEAASAQLEVSTELLERTGAEGRPFAVRWHRAVARLLRARNLFPVAERVLERARERLPDSADIFYESGVLEERLAANPTLPAIVHLPDSRTPAGPAGRMGPDGQVGREHADVSKRARSGRLRRAERWFRTAIRLDPSNAWARLRLGRVLSLQGQRDEARRLLTPIASDPVLSYMANLFLGAIYEQENASDRAAAAYRRAVESNPKGHAARIALSAVLVRSGLTAEGRQVLHGAVGSASARSDPWWWYLSESSSAAGESLADVRREVRG